MFQKKFIEYLQYEKRYSANTLRSYENDINSFYLFLEQKGSNPDIRKADHKAIREWIISLLEQDITPRSVNRKISSLKSFYRFLVKQEFIQTNPMDKVTAPRQSKRLPEFIREEEMDKLFETDIFPDSFTGLRDQVIILLLYTCGLRRAELVGLKTEDYRADSLQIKVMGKRNKERMIPLLPEVAQKLDQYLALRETMKGSADSSGLFITEKGKPIYDKFVYRVVKHYITLVSKIKKRSPHVIRHSFATHMLNRGADLNAIKELLGHANLAATEVYTHNSFEKLKQTYKQAHPRA